MSNGSTWRWAAVVIFAIMLGAGGGWFSRQPQRMACENNELVDPRPRDANHCYLDER